MKTHELRSLNQMYNLMLLSTLRVYYVEIGHLISISISEMPFFMGTMNVRPGDISSLCTCKSHIYAHLKSYANLVFMYIQTS